MAFSARKSSIDSAMKLQEEELFVIPDGEKYILYAPLNQTALLVSKGVIDLLSRGLGAKALKDLSADEKIILSTMFQLGVIGKKRTISHSLNARFWPTFATLFLTTRCNLRCEYCYASGGEKRAKDLPATIAKSAIDLIIENTLKAEQKTFGIAFHGGGEQTLSWDVLQSSVSYARSKAADHDLSAQLSIATNGVLEENKLEWIIENFQSVNVSLDGPKDIQDKQRPMADGSGSFDKVFLSAKKLSKRKFPFSVRVTITDSSVNRMPQIVSFLSQECGAKRIHIEPVYECGRCMRSGSSAPSADNFVQQFKYSQDTANQLGVSLFYSGASITNIKNIFCKAAGESFCVTTDGNVTSCYEVCSHEDPRSAKFFYGKYDSISDSFLFDTTKLQQLKNRTVENIAFCKDCFCKYHCAGDCMAKTSKSDGLLAISNPYRCFINQELTKYQIAELLVDDAGLS